MATKQHKTVCVVVLGDIGRSPRMQYHLLSLSNLGYNVNVIGYKETEFKHSNLKIHPLRPFPVISKPKLLNYIIKTIWQCFSLLFALLSNWSDYVLVQNPPAVPTLLICWFCCLCTRAKLIIDWHNYAHTIMALNVGEKHVLVKLTKWMECYFGRKAYANFSVTNAMRIDLETNWNIKSATLYDKPPRIFHAIDLKTKHDLLLRLSQDYPIFGDDLNKTNTTITEINSDNEVVYRTNRSALLISSTSWTEDEDFSILLNSLQNYEQSCEDNNLRNLPKLICIITGKGPLKEYYKSVINDLKMKHVSIITPWLDASDYPLLLATADLGVCLHTSSSGLDLPMKVVDMFGCCLPVCAYDFNCLNELVKHEVNSYVFQDSDQLTAQLLNWFDNFPNNKIQHKIETKFKQELENFQSERWEENWTRNALPVFQ